MIIAVSVTVAVTLERMGTAFTLPDKDLRGFGKFGNQQQSLAAG